MSAIAMPFLDAWRDLDTDRQWVTSMAGAIPRMIQWTSLDAFARRHGVDAEDFDDLVYIIRTADAAWMKQLNKIRANKPPPPPPKDPRR